MHGKVGGSGSLKSEINVTPLVDVCLVLLIIFMVVGPMLGQGRAELPETSNPPRMSQTEQLEVVMESDGRVFVGDRWIPSQDLLRAVRQVHERSPERKVVIKADRRLRYHEIRGVMRTLCEAGFSSAGLAVQKKKPTA